MKYSLFFLTFFLSVQTAFADNWKDYISPDTIKSPEGKALTQKQLRRLGGAAVGTDYSLSATKKKADELFNHLGYMASVDKYEKLEGLELNEFVMSKMANSFRLNGDYEKAEYWYARCIGETPFSEDYLHFAQVLQINGKCEDAVRWSNKYLEETLDITRNVITDCEQLSTIQKHENVEVKNILTLNTSNLDFSAVPHENGLVFTSNRGVERLTKKQDRWTKNEFTDLFFAEMKDGVALSIKPFEGVINHSLHDGTATFTEIGTEMIFSRSDEAGMSTRNIKELQLYTSVYQDGKWSEARKLKFCHSEFAYSHPAFSVDGKKVYFTSNERTGGYGGMDIWVSEKEGDTWGKPVNLGPNVNTSGNEIFPFIAKNNSLFFSSDGHRGLGGLDIFTVSQSLENDDRSWNNRSNVGAPLNTEKDDFGFTLNNDNKSGYLSSNREGGQGGDDIYYWAGELSPKEILRSIIVTDKVTNELLQNVTVSYIDPRTGIRQHEQTNDEGEFLLSLDPRNDYTFVISEDGYLPFRTVVDGEDLNAERNNKLSLIPVKALSAVGQVYNLENNAPIFNAKMLILNRCTNEMVEVYTNGAGQFIFDIECDCEYEILSEKLAYEDAKKIFSIKGDMCRDNILKNKPAELMFGLKKIEVNRPYEYETATSPRTPDISLNRFFLGSDELHFEEGQVIRLSNLYYDFDKYNIRRDAKVELNHVYELLRTYPTMKIALMSHTDARGTDRYNQRLSRKRAAAARDHLISRGIHPDRLSSVGVGEALPVNDCTNGVDCDEEEHQLNRRTEIKITALSESGVKVNRD